MNLESSDSPARSRPRIWTSFAAIICAILLAIVFQSVMAVVLVVEMMATGAEGSELQEKLADSLTGPALFLLTLVLGQAAFAMVTLLAGRLSPEPMKQRLGFDGTPVTTELCVMAMLGSIFVLAIGIGFANLVAMFIEPDDLVETLFEKMTPMWGVLLVVLISLLPGFIEETLFRGYIQTRFLKRWSPVSAILFTSFLFALVHITPHAIAFAFPAGIWFGYLAWRTNSIWPGIACHVFINGGLNTWRLIAKFAQIPENMVYVGNGVFVLIGIVAFVLALKMMAKLPKPQQKEAVS